MVGGAQAQPFGGQSESGGDRQSPWGGDSSKSELARDAGANDVGNSSRGEPSRLFDDNTGHDEPADDDDDFFAGADDGFDGGDDA
jgi:hypothetical protein